MAEISNIGQIRKCVEDDDRLEKAFIKMEKGKVRKHQSVGLECSS